MRIEFGEWTPDIAAYDARGTPDVQNALPQARGWGPIPKPVDSGFGGITGTPNVLFQVTDENGNSTVFAGDNTKLYKYTQNVGFEDVSRAGGYTDQGHPWQWALFGTALYMVNGADTIQRWDLGTSSNFFDSPGAVTAGDLSARYITVIRNSLVIGFVGANSNRIQWTNVGQPEDWQSGQASFYEIPNLGEIRGLTGGEYGLALLEDGLVRIDYLGGPPDFFQFDEIEESVGCLEPRTVIRSGSRTYYLSKQGWRAFNGQQSFGFGIERIDRTFFDLVKEESYSLMSRTLFPTLKAIGWLFVTASSIDSRPNAMLIYNEGIDRPGVVLDSPDNPFKIDCLGYTATPSVNSDQLDGTFPNSDSVGGINDARTWKGDTLEIASAIDRDGKLQTFTGLPMTGIFETGDYRLNGRGTARGQEVVPLVHGDAAPTLDVGERWALSESLVWDSGIALNSSGFFPLDSVAKFHRFRLKTQGDWRHAVGIEIEGISAGEW